MKKNIIITILVATLLLTIAGRPSLAPEPPRTLIIMPQPEEIKEAVKKIQIEINRVRKSYGQPEIKVDGLYGTQTKDALIEYRLDRKIAGYEKDFYQKSR